MKYRYLGNSGLAVANIALGTMTFGNEKWGTNRESSENILNKYYELGGNFIDTSNHYSDGKSEVIIGDWLKKKNRESIILSTKCGFTRNENLNARGLSRNNIIESCNESLKRLRTDYIDLFQFYDFDPTTPLEETLATFDLLFKQGKVRYLGLSNSPGWKVTKIHFLSKNNSYSPIISGQYLYNLLKRDIELEVIPALKDSNMGLICWSPLSGGMLTGKYNDPDNPPANSRLGNRSELSKNRYKHWFQKSINIINELQAISEKHNISVSQVALSWLLRKNIVASVITGASSVHQVSQNCYSSEVEIDETSWCKIEETINIHDYYPNNWITTNKKDWFNNIK